MRLAGNVTVTLTTSDTQSNARRSRVTIDAPRRGKRIRDYALYKFTFYIYITLVTAQSGELWAYPTLPFPPVRPGWAHRTLIFHELAKPEVDIAFFIYYLFVDARPDRADRRKTGKRTAQTPTQTHTHTHTHTQVSLMKTHMLGTSLLWRSTVAFT